MKSDKLGNYITVSCKNCFDDVRVKCGDENQVALWNSDLMEGIGAGVYIQYETLCTECEEEVRYFEDYFEKKN